MVWRLISYSEVKMPLPPYVFEYFIGIVKDEAGQNIMVQIDKLHTNNISIDAIGIVEKRMGLIGEINIFIPLMHSNESKVIGLSEAPHTYKEIKTVAVIGTGVMGTGIAQEALQQGFNVVFKSRSKEALNTAVAKIEAELLRRMSHEEKDKLFKNILITTNVNDLINSDIIIECTIEDEVVKRQIFSELDLVCSEETIFATNTSSLSIDALSSTVSNPKRFIGMHFFNPVTKMLLIEVICGKNTSLETIDTTINFAKLLNKVPVIVKDTPGFIVNRVLFSMINESIHMVDAGVATAKEIDIAMKLGANFPIGPLELADFVGLDISHKIIKTLNLSLPGFKQSANILEKMIVEGSLGRKTKKGFYDY